MGEVVYVLIAHWMDCDSKVLGLFYSTVAADEYLSEYIDNLKKNGSYLPDRCVIEPHLVGDPNYEINECKTIGYYNDYNDFWGNDGNDDGTIFEEDV